MKIAIALFAFFVACCWAARGLVRYTEREIRAFFEARDDG